MTKLTIEHNWNSYSWIGDKWGEMTLGEQCKMRIWDAQVYFTFENWVVVDTYHSPDQLVKLWYMELQPQEEKCNHVSDWMVYTSNPPQYKCKKCSYMTTEYMAQEEKPEKTVGETVENVIWPLYSSEQSILQKLRADIDARRKWAISDIEFCKWHPETMKFYEWKEIAYDACIELLNELEKEQVKTMSYYEALEYVKKNWPTDMRDSEGIYLIKVGKHADKDVLYRSGTETIYHEGQSFQLIQETQPSQPEEWTPKKGDMIEVSNDGNWTGKTIYFQEYKNWAYSDWYESYEFARPLSQPQPIVPEFDYEKDELRHIMGHIGKQLEAVTKHLLIDKLNNK